MSKGGTQVADLCRGKIKGFVPKHLWPLEGNRTLFRKIHMENPIQKFASYEGLIGAGEDGLPCTPPF